MRTLWRTLRHKWLEFRGLRTSITVMDSGHFKRGDEILVGGERLLVASAQGDRLVVSQPKKKISVWAPIWKKITSRQFWRSIPGKVWRAVCRILISILEFRLKDWLYEQVYPRDGYDVLSSGDRYDRL